MDSFFKELVKQDYGPAVNNKVMNTLHKIAGEYASFADNEGYICDVLAEHEKATYWFRQYQGFRFVQDFLASFMKGEQDEENK